jgi:hypothetical protein
MVSFLYRVLRYMDIVTQIASKTENDPLTTILAPKEDRVAGQKMIGPYLKKRDASHISLIENERQKQSFHHNDSDRLCRSLDKSHIAKRQWSTTH